MDSQTEYVNKIAYDNIGQNKEGLLKDQEKGEEAI